MKYANAPDFPAESEGEKQFEQHLQGMYSPDGEGDPHRALTELFQRGDLGADFVAHHYHHTRAIVEDAEALRLPSTPAHRALKAMHRGLIEQFDTEPAWYASREDALTQAFEKIDAPSPLPDILEEVAQKKDKVRAESRAATVEALLARNGIEPETLTPAEHQIIGVFSALLEGSERPLPAMFSLRAERVGEQLVSRLQAGYPAQGSPHGDIAVRPKVAMALYLKIREAEDERPDTAPLLLTMLDSAMGRAQIHRDGRFNDELNQDLHTAYNFQNLHLAEGVPLPRNLSLAKSKVAESYAAPPGPGAPGRP